MQLHGEFMPCLIDLENGQETHLNNLVDARLEQFSRNGKWLCVYARENKDCVFIEVATGKVKQQFAGEFRSFCKDERHVFLRDRSAGGPIRVADLESGKVLELPKEAWDFAVAPDGRHLVTWMNARPASPKNENHASPKSWERGLFVWELSTLQMKHRLDFDHHADRRLAFSPDSRFVASWLVHAGNSDLEIVELLTGRNRLKLPAGRARSGVFSHDGEMFCLEHSGTVTMFDTSVGLELWDSPGLSLGFAEPNGCVIQLQNVNGTLLFVNARTGQLNATAPADFVARSTLLGPAAAEINSPQWTPDRRHFCIPGSLVRNRAHFVWEEWLQRRWPKLFGDSSQITLVMESATGRELFRTAHNDMAKWLLSDDASTLVIVNFVAGDAEDRVVCVWDVSPTRAYLWAIGAAAGTGVVLLALNRLTRKFTRRSASIQQAPPLIAPA
jgi:hypothetical protein